MYARQMKAAFVLGLLACAQSREFAPEPDTAGPDTGVPPSCTIPDEAPAEQVDVLIVGGGGSGLAAAWEAREAGVSVRILERRDELGGAGRFARSHWAAGTQWQADSGVEDSAEFALEEWADFTHGGDPAHPWIQAFVHGSAENLEWVQSLGSDYADPEYKPDAGSVPRVHNLDAANLAQPAPALLAEILADQAWMEHTVTELVACDGRVVGAVYETIEGTTGWVEAKATVTATGGHGRDLARLVENVVGLDAHTIHHEAHPWMDGNGLAMIEGVGGAMANLAGTGLFSHSATDPVLGPPEVAVVIALEKRMIVAADGRRVVDEDQDRGFYLGQVHLKQGPLWAIYDAEMWRQAGFQRFSYNTEGEPSQWSGEEYAEAMDTPTAASPAEVAAAAGIDPDGLAQQMADWNAAIADGHDPDFGRDMGDVEPFGIGPYTALPLALSTARSFGGADIGIDAGVRDAGGTPIPGLYAAGETVGFLGGSHVGVGFQGTMNSVLFVGRVAGREAAAFAASQPD